MPGPVDDDLEVISRAAGLVRHQLLPAGPGRRSRHRAGAVAGARGRGAARRPALRAASASPTCPTTDFGWAIVPDGLRQILTPFKERYGDSLPPVYITESGCSYPRHRRRRRRRARHGPDRLPRRAPARASPTRSRPASTSAATSRGRCWTTSSGPRATRSASAWCTSTSTPQQRTPKDSYHWFQRLLAGRPEAASA